LGLVLGRGSTAIIWVWSRLGWHFKHHVNNAASLAGLDAVYVEQECVELTFVASDILVVVPDIQNGLTRLGLQVEDCQSLFEPAPAFRCVIARTLEDRFIIIGVLDRRFIGFLSCR
jgi:hypothetical protein